MLRSLVFSFLSKDQLICTIESLFVHFWSVPENFLGFIKLFKAFLGCSIPNRTFLPSRRSIHINCLLPLFLAFDNSDVTVADRVDNYIIMLGKKILLYKNSRCHTKNNMNCKNNIKKSIAGPSLQGNGTTFENFNFLLSIHSGGQIQLSV